MTKKATNTTRPTISKSEFEEMKHEVARLREKERIILQRLDHAQSKLDWSFRHPFRFFLGRVYHQYIKRDQKNVQD